MRHALYMPPFGTFGDVHVLVALAAEAEAAGWDGFFVWDHVLYADDVPFVDPWIGLTAVAAATERLRIAPLVTPLARRRVWKVAREAVTLDHLSRGRLTLGVGLGIDFWREYSAFAETATSDALRAEMVDDGIDVLRALWSGETVSYDGKHVHIDSARFLPRPHQPTIPIWSAASWPVRPGPARRAARCDGVMPFSPSGPIPPGDIAALRQRIGRPDPATFDVCLHGPPERAADYETAGVTWFCLSFGHDQPLDDVRRLVAAGPPHR